MIKKPFQALAILPFAFGSLLGDGSSQQFVSPFTGQYLLAQKEMSLTNRYADKFVNNVFKDNILLNLAYLGDKVTSSKDIKWDEIAKPFQYEFKLEPKKTFAFHSDVQAKFQNSLVKTTNAHFNAQEGFKTDGYLFGDGVCHLASLINWAAREAGLEVEAPTNHNFANIPDVPKEYGVSIYSNPWSRGSNALQNLYITNNKTKPVAFRFAYQDNKVKVSVVELN
ncbi:MAG: VanW family protein [Candidatus Daviesbacteria bacterium]|nr:VanW family protein [Candidatus Daviesbacteria bacterium]